jgi:hypothetical protein
MIYSQKKMEQVHALNFLTKNNFFLSAFIIFFHQYTTFYFKEKIQNKDEIFCIYYGLFDLIFTFYYSRTNFILNKNLAITLIILHIQRTY